MEKLLAALQTALALVALPLILLSTESSVLVKVVLALLAVVSLVTGLMVATRTKGEA